MLDHYNTAIGNSEKLIIFLLIEKGLALTTVTETSLSQIQDEARDTFLTIAFMCGINHKWYRDLYDEILNSYLTTGMITPKISLLFITLLWNAG